eukprot:scpid28577/ scgid19252/ 
MILQLQQQQQAVLSLPVHGAAVRPALHDADTSGCHAQVSAPVVRAAARAVVSLAFPVASRHTPTTRSRLQVSSGTIASPEAAEQLMPFVHGVEVCPVPHATGIIWCPTQVSAAAVAAAETAAEAPRLLSTVAGEGSEWPYRNICHHRGC